MPPWHRCNLCFRRFVAFFCPAGVLRNLSPPANVFTLVRFPHNATQRKIVMSPFEVLKSELLNCGKVLRWTFPHLHQLPWTSAVGSRHRHHGNLVCDTYQVLPWRNIIFVAEGLKIRARYHKESFRPAWNDSSCTQKKYCFTFIVLQLRRRTSSHSQSFLTTIQLTFFDKICPPPNPKVVKTSGSFPTTPSQSEPPRLFHLTLIQTTINTFNTMIRRRPVHRQSNYT